MARNLTFSRSREPCRSDTSLTRHASRTTGPFSFLNPTRAAYTHSTLGADPLIDVDDLHFLWTSRDNRKGRHAIARRSLISPVKPTSHPLTSKPASSSAKSIAEGLWRMLVRYPYYDVSWLVAVVFTWGSVVWVLNGFFVFLPDINGQGESFAGEVVYGGGITAFVGATIFEIGSVLLILEAMNENRAGCFGWAIEYALEGKSFFPATADECGHHHATKRNLVGGAEGENVEKAGGLRDEGKEADDGEDERRANARGWVWLPTRHEFSSHYLHELGFLACAAQLFGASVFWISGFTALPGINNVMSQGLVDGIYWTPQVVGGSGFIVSSVFFMLETQRKWYLPALDVLGWHIGFWNLIGALGFTLSGALGYAYMDDAALYQAGCSTFWGSWAFLIGSCIQWYESLDKYPVIRKKH